MSQRAASPARRRTQVDRRRRRRIAFALWAVAAASGVLDFLVYVDAIDIMSPGVANFVLGGPMVVLAVAGAIVYGS